MSRRLHRIVWGALALLGICLIISYSEDIRTVYYLLFFRSQQGLAVPLDQGCEVENYRAGQGSDLGALAVRACWSQQPLLWGPVLKMSLTFNPNDRDLRQGEVWMDLDSLGRGKWFDLAGGGVEALLLIPRAMSSKKGQTPYTGAQIIVEAEDYQGHRHKLYGNWHDLNDWATPERVTAQVSPDYRGAYRDPGFVGSEHRIRKIGVKLALNDAAHSAFEGVATLIEIRVFPPDAETSRRERAQAQQLRRPPPDEETLRKLPPLEPGSEASRPLRGRFEAANSFVKSIALVPEPGRRQQRVYKAEILFPAYQDDVDARSARLSYDVGGLLNAHASTLKAWVAVGPSLRGYGPRANVVQFELWDKNGHVQRGPASDLSSGVRLDSTEREYQSVWIPLQIRHDFTSGEGGFRWDQIDRIGVRLLVGKFSNEFYGTDRLEGALLLSHVRMEKNSHPPEQANFVSRAPVAKPPVPIGEFRVGVNYDYAPMYGYSLANYFYGGRSRCGFSSPSSRRKLHRDFTNLVAHGIRLVRVWLFADMRAGLETSGEHVKADPCVAADLDALLSAVAAHPPLACIPVLLDFYAADGASPVKQAGNRKWTEGEHPNLLTSDRRSLIDGFRPIVRTIAAWNRDHPGLIYAIDLMNEPENASAVMQAGRAGEFRSFLREMRDMIWAEDPNLPVTLGSRNRRDMRRMWDFEDRPKWVWQYHYYDAMEQEEDLPLHFPAGRLGLKQPVILGEVEPSGISSKLDTIHADGYHAAIFWSMNELDGYRVNLKEVRRWLDSKKGK
jgi:hypothetical protein